MSPPVQSKQEEHGNSGRRSAEICQLCLQRVKGYLSRVKGQEVPVRKEEMGPRAAVWDALRGAGTVTHWEEGVRVDVSPKNPRQEVAGSHRCHIDHMPAESSWPRHSV